MSVPELAPDEVTALLAACTGAGAGAAGVSGPLGGLVASTVSAGRGGSMPRST